MKLQRMCVRQSYSIDFVSSFSFYSQIDDFWYDNNREAYAILEILRNMISITPLDMPFSFKSKKKSLQAIQ